MTIFKLKNKRRWHPGNPIKNPTLTKEVKNIRILQNIGKIQGQMGFYLATKVMKRQIQVRKMVGGTQENNLLMQIIMVNGMIIESQKSFLLTFKILSRCPGW